MIAREKHHVIHQSNIRKPRRATPASILRLGLLPLALLTLTTITNRLGADPTFTDVTRVDSPDILFRNNQAGGFEDVTIAAGLSANLPTNGPTFADIDNDGDQDLYVTSNDASQYYLYINDDTGHFTEEALARGAAINRLPVADGNGR